MNNKKYINHVEEQLKEKNIKNWKWADRNLRDKGEIHAEIYAARQIK